MYLFQSKCKNNTCKIKTLKETTKLFIYFIHTIIHPLYCFSFSKIIHSLINYHTVHLNYIYKIKKWTLLGNIHGRP